MCKRVCLCERKRHACGVHVFMLVCVCACACVCADVFVVMQVCFVQQVVQALHNVNLLCLAENTKKHVSLSAPHCIILL